MNKKFKKSIIILTGIAMISTLSLLSSCVEDDETEYASCGGGTCDSSEPYSNEYSSNCYPSQSDCESATGHACTNCD